MPAKRRRSALPNKADLPSLPSTPSKGSKKTKEDAHRVRVAKTGWVWSTGDADDKQVPIKSENGNVYYHHITFIPESGSVPMRITVEDLVVTTVDTKDEETAMLKLTYWVGQVAALFETPEGEPEVLLRFFDQSKQWFYMNNDPRLLKAFGKSFRRYELLETDVCEKSSVEIIVKKVNWFETEEQAVIDNQHLGTKDIPNGFFSDRMVVRCGADGRRRHDLSDSLWPAPLSRRRQRLTTQCPVSLLSIRSGENTKVSSKQIVQSTVPLDVYSRAVEALKLSVLPEHLPCRESETGQIREFIRTAVKSTGQSGNVLYISGVPGTGKTASVLSVISGLKKEKKSLKFEFGYINSMKLNTPTDLFVEMLGIITTNSKRYSRSDKPQDILTKHFSTRDSDRPVTVLLVDEIDYLVTKSQQVVYQLFDWPLLVDSKLVLITISNTMDLPERLMPRVASRLGLARLNYLPYNAEQIRKVVQERLKDSNSEEIFKPESLQFVALRVAHSSGDIRKALHICRRAIEVRSGDVVSVPDMNKAQYDLYSNPFVAVMSNLSYLCRLVLIAVVLESNMTNTDSVSLRALWIRFETLSKNFQPHHRFRIITFSDFKKLVNSLQKLSIVSVVRYSGPAVTAPAVADRLVVDDDVLQKPAGKKIAKKMGPAKCFARDNGADEDEEGSGYLISLNSLLENSDVKHALVEGANDRVAQRLL